MKYKFLGVLIVASLMVVSCANPQSPTAPSTPTSPTSVPNSYTLMFVAGVQSNPVTFEVYDSYPIDHGGIGKSWGPATGTQGVTDIIYNGSSSSPVTYDWALGSFVYPVTVQCFALKNGIVVNSLEIVAPTSGTSTKFQGSM